MFKALQGYESFLETTKQAPIKSIPKKHISPHIIHWYVAREREELVAKLGPAASIWNREFMSCKHRMALRIPGIMAKKRSFRRRSDKIALRRSTEVDQKTKTLPKYNIETSVVS
ncbi:MAG: hypothetical protein QXU48_02505 [Thermoplasmata archaeon]